jgi:hypothetical protein
MKKCKICNGKGFNFSTITIVGKSMFSMKEKGIKVSCTKCFGKGVK